MKIKFKYLLVLFIGLTIISCSNDDDSTPPKVDKESPILPNSLKASIDSKGKVTLTWKSATDNVKVVSYEIKSESTVIKNVNDDGSPEYTHSYQSNLIPNNEYEFSLTAKDKAGNVSNVITAKAKFTIIGIDNVAPVISKFEVTNKYLSSFVLKWEHAEKDIESFELKQNGKVLKRLKGNVLSYLVMSVDTTIDNTFSITAKDISGYVSKEKKVVIKKSVKSEVVFDITADGNKLIAYGTNQSTKLIKNSLGKEQIKATLNLINYKPLKIIQLDLDFLVSKFSAGKTYNLNNSSTDVTVLFKEKFLGKKEYTKFGAGTELKITSISNKKIVGSIVGTLENKTNTEKISISMDFDMNVTK